MKWADLTSDEQTGLDEVIPKGMIAAILFLRPRVTMSDAMGITHRRREELGLAPSHEAPTLEKLRHKLEEGLGDANVISIQASWEGDTSGWSVRLDAILEGNAEIYLGEWQGAGGDYRLFTGEVPPWPEVEWANKVGKELADSLPMCGFWFDHSDGPEIHQEGK